MKLFMASFITKCVRQNSIVYQKFTKATNFHKKGR